MDRAVYDKVAEKPESHPKYAEYIEIASQDNKFIPSLINSITTQYKMAQPAEKTKLYGDIKGLFNCCLEYQLAVTTD